MLGLVLSALRARAAQAWAVFVLAVLLVTAAAAGPWFAAGAERRAAAADVAAAPAAERTISVRRQTNADGDPRSALAAYRDTVERLLPGTGLLGVTANMLLDGADSTPRVSVAHRDDVCEHVRLDGRCPQAAGEVLVSVATADALGLHPGDALTLRNQPRAKPVPVTVVGRYELADPGGVYWGDSLFRADAGGLDPLFTAVDTFESPQLAGPVFVYTAELPESAFTDPGSPAGDRLRAADFALSRGGMTLVAPGQQLVDRIAADRAAIRGGALAGTLGTVVLCWFALALAGRQTARERRGDAALLQLRGGSRRRVLRLGVGQLAVPLLAALPIGLALGWLAGRLLGGPAAGFAPPFDGALGPWLPAGLAAVAGVLGGLAALAAGELAVLRAPVEALLRRVPSPGRARRAAVDVVLVVLAGFAAAQLWGTGLRTAVPLLVAVVVAVVAARMLATAASRAGAGALRAGRLRAGFAAVALSRQPGADRLMALVAVAVAGLCAATGGWLAGFDARDSRAAQELGAPRVLTVRAGNPTALLDAVRRADPGGREAMAAVVDAAATPPVVAVDAARLPAVAAWRPQWGPRPALVPPGTGADAPAVTGGRLVLRARNDGAEPVRLAVAVQNTVTGRTARLTLGPVDPGEHEAAADVAGCAEGCRVVSLDLLQPRPANAGDAPPKAGPDTPPSDVAAAVLTITELRQEAPAGRVLDAAFLGDPRQWRTGAKGPAMQVSARQGALTLTLPDVAWNFDDRVYVMAAGLPLPAVLAGEVPGPWRLGDPSLELFGGGAVPVHVAGTAPMLPVVGGSGVLVDLDAAQRLGAGGSSAGTYQVWLATGAGAGVEDRLRAAGLTILGADDTGARAARFAARGPAVAERYRLFAAVLGLLAAAAALAVAVAAERRQRGADLRALRVQGLAARTAAAAGRAGSGAVVLAGVLAGLLAAIVARFASGPPLPYFADGWNPPDPPEPLPPLPLLATAAAALLLLALVWRAATAGRAEGKTR
ncbi:FtsX-like permease family protein [Dactylosporangium sp. NPDC000244]|uniref:FtsX-like permease family protein n=1 Tax=Dactylosporangium sp. NPDC000244 TaxID=3154365 RepID=UPI00331FEDF2